MKKIAIWFDTLWDWAVWSSVNEDRISSTVKYFFLTLGVLLTGVLGFGHIAFPAAELTSISDQVITLIQEVLLSIGTIGTIISAVRKLWLTVRGQNAVFVTPSVSITPSSLQS